MKAVRMFGILFCLLLMTAGTVWGDSARRITELANQVHNNVRNLVGARRLSLPAAVQQQKTFLLRQPEVAKVKLLRGNNLMVHFRDGNELLMFLADDYLGSAYERVPMQQQKKVLSPSQQTISKSQIDRLPASLPCAPERQLALLFDCLGRGIDKVGGYLSSLGYSVVVPAIGNEYSSIFCHGFGYGPYGVIILRTHGADLGEYFGILLESWYKSYPPASVYMRSALRASFYSHRVNAPRFGYVYNCTSIISALRYWHPSAIFFLETCYGASPVALSGPATVAIRKGASVWVGWNGPVDFNCGEYGTERFFRLLKEQKTVAEAVAAVNAARCGTSELVAFPSNGGRCRLASFKSDPNESNVDDVRDVKLLRLVSTGSQLHLDIEFYANLAIGELLFYVDTGGTSDPEIMVRCHSDNVEAYKQSRPKVFDNKVYTGKASIRRTFYTYNLPRLYSFDIPWSTCFGRVSQVKVWLYDMRGKDRVPNRGSITLMR